MTRRPFILALALLSALAIVAHFALSAVCGLHTGGVTPADLLP